MNKELRKAIMARTRLLNKHRKDNSTLSKIEYNKQRNICVKLLRKSKKDFYNNLNAKSITDSKSFWKTVKPSFSDKTLKNETISLIENDKVITEENEVVKIFDSHFSNVVQNLDIENINCISVSDDPVIEAIKSFENHPSIMKINTIFDTYIDLFRFQDVNLDDISREINNLDKSKACQENDIPTKIIKENCDIFAEHLLADFNRSVNSNTFPDILKLADVRPIFKKEDRTDKCNYRPVSILSNISKIYERCIYNQLYQYFDDILSKNQFGFRKGYSAQQCLLVMIEKLRHCADQGGAFGVLLTDLSKAFDKLANQLLIAKHYAYGVEISSLRFIFSYLSERKQRVKLNNSYSPWSDIMFGVPQGSILGPLLFNIFISDLFLFLPDDIVSYADDNTPYYTGKDTMEVLSALENKSEIMIKWFKDNSMKANPDKYHMILSDKNQCTITVGDELVVSSDQEKLLGIKIDKELKFNLHVESLRKKASQKVNAFFISHSS